MSNDTIMSPEDIQKLLENAGIFTDPADDLGASSNKDSSDAEPTATFDDDADALDLSHYLDDVQCDILGEVGNICMGTSATTLYDLLERQVYITTPKVSIQTKQSLMKEYPMPIVCVAVHYTDGIEGDNVLLLKEYDVALITNLLIGGDGSVDPNEIEMDELHLSAIREVMNQLIGSSATSMATMLNTSVNISTPISKRMLVADDSLDELIGDDIFAVINFKMEIENLLTSQIMQIWPFSFAKKICSLVLGEVEAQYSAPENTTSANITAVSDSFLHQTTSQTLANNALNDSFLHQTASQALANNVNMDAILASNDLSGFTPMQQPSFALPQEPLYQHRDAPQQAPNGQPQQYPQQQAPNGQPQQYPQQQAPNGQPQYPQQPYPGQPQYPQQQPYPGQPQYPQQPYPGMPPYGAYPGYPAMPPYGAYPGYPGAVAPSVGNAVPQHQSRNIVQGDSPTVKSVIYPSFEDPNSASNFPHDNLNLIMKVPVDVSVLLGQKRLKIKEVLDFNIGSVIVLDKIAGEPVEIFVNGTSVAKGEVVVVEDNYGVRITEINTAHLIDTL